MEEVNLPSCGWWRVVDLEICRIVSFKFTLELFSEWVYLYALIFSFSAHEDKYCFKNKELNRCWFFSPRFMIPPDILVPDILIPEFYVPY